MGSGGGQPIHPLTLFLGRTEWASGSQEGGLDRSEQWGTELGQPGTDGSEEPFCQLPSWHGWDRSHHHHDSHYLTNAA